MPPEYYNQQAEDQAVTSQELHAEMQDFLQTQEQRRRVFPRAALVGLVAGLLTVAFRWALDGGEALRTRLIAWAHHYPAWPTAETRLESGDRITTVVAPQAAAAMLLLRQGCEAPPAARGTPAEPTIRRSPGGPQSV